MKVLAIFTVGALAAAGALWWPKPASAHAEQRIGTVQAPISIRWATTPVRFRINNQTSANLPNIAAGSLPVQAVDQAFATISAASGIPLQNAGTTSIQSVGNDGTNIVTFADTPANRALTAGSIAVTLTTFTPSTGALLDADIAFNPLASFSTVQGAMDYDIESVALHEAGHFLGQDHSPILGATMFPFVGTGSISNRVLMPDDIAGLATIYPPSGTSTGRVQGRVLRAGQVPVFGAHVVFQDAVTGEAVLGVITGPDGRFDSRRLPPGLYHPFVEPLDEPFLPIDLVTTLAPVAGIDTSFRSGFWGGTNAPGAAVAVRAGQTAQLGDWVVQGPNPTFNPRFLGASTTPTGNVQLVGLALAVTPPAQGYLTVAGPGLLTIPDSGFRMDSPLISLGSFATASGTLANGDGFKTFPYTVGQSTPAGTYSLRIEGRGEVAFVAGAIRVLPRTPKLAATAAYGQGCGGSIGIPSILPISTPSVGQSGFGINITNTRANHIGFLFISTLPAQTTVAPGCVAHVDLNALLIPFPGLPFATQAAITRIDLPIPADPQLAGLELYLQALVTDSLSITGVALSRALWLRIE